VLAEAREAGVTHVAMEASSHGLDQRRLDGVWLAAAGFTNLTQDHLDYHGTMEAYFEAKARLFRAVLPEDGVAVVNLDDSWGRRSCGSPARGGRR
jgi:UDP-N-acetylmuramoyl-L-alanyl-D-glutamate--2,6-diaminopimelate ligase